MTEPRYTPGPWTVFHDDCDYCKKQGDENWFVLDGPPITEHGGFARQADAHLIAAAPELYEALFAIIDTVRTSIPIDLAKKALAALEKAGWQSDFAKPVENSQ